MTDGEELLDYLELFHFVVRIIGEDLNFLDIFKNGLAKILRSRVERFISELPSSDRKLSETSFIHSDAYNFLQTQITSQMKMIIDSIRRAKLWIPQGTGGQRSDPGAIISSVIKIEPEKIGIPELAILRSIPTEKLTFSPDLTLYYISLLHATLSPDKFVRSFSYSLLRSAPQLFDPRHFFNVLKEALKFWEVPQDKILQTNSEVNSSLNENQASDPNSNSNSSSNQNVNSSLASNSNKDDQNVEVTFEFAASLALLLNSLSEIIHSVLDDDIEELLFCLIESIPKSPHFSLLIIFDPSFKWLINTLPIKSFKAVLESSLDMLSSGSFAHLCLVCRAVSHGIIGPDILVPAVKKALPTADKWPKAMRRETRVLFSGLVTRLPQTAITSILDILAEQFSLINCSSNDNNNNNENNIIDDRIRIQVLVFSDFVVNYMLNTTAPFHESFYASVQNLVILYSSKISHNAANIHSSNSNTSIYNSNSKRNIMNRNGSTIGPNVRMFSNLSLNGSKNVFNLNISNDADKNDNAGDYEALIKMFCALCANPVRFLQSVEKTADRSVFKLPFRASHTTLYSVLFEPNETALLSGDEALKSGENFFVSVKQIDEIDPIDFSVTQIETCIRLSLWPKLFRNFLINKVLYPSSTGSFSAVNNSSAVNLNSTTNSMASLNLQIDSWMVSEDIKYYILQVMQTIAIREASPETVQKDFSDFLSAYIISSNESKPNNNNNSPSSNSNENNNENNNTHETVHYECEYSEMIRQICSFMRKQTSSFEILKEKIPSSASDIFSIGSKQLVVLSLLFEYTIWNEPKNLIVCFKRSRIPSTEWFAFIASSLFVTIFNEPIGALEQTLIKFSTESPLYFVWFAVVVVEKLSQSWLDLIADENFAELVRMMLFPKMSDGFSDKEIQYAMYLHKNYQNVFNRFYNVINCE